MAAYLPTALALLSLALLAAAPASAAPPGADREREAGHQTFASPQSNPIALSPDGRRLYVANTTSGTVDVLDVGSAPGGAAVIASVPVGLDPVSVTVRPDGREVWVANHVSDSVSVIDTDPFSRTLHQVVETVQEIDPDTGVTRFDEPVGIAFAEDDSKAYVALSSTDRVAVVDARTYTVAKHLPISAQDPRALAVRDGLLFVAAFESGNQTQLSVCPDLVALTNDGDTRSIAGDPPQCTLSIGDLNDFVLNPQLTGRPSNVVVNPDQPDRDLFVFDIADETPVDVVTGVGTLLYGVAAGPGGRVWVTLTDARNESLAGEGEGLVDLQNRLFLNQVAALQCSPSGCSGPAVIDLEPRPEVGDPPDGEQLATPYGVAVSGDGSTLVATAAATSRIFTLDAATGAVADILDLSGGDADAFGQQIPRGVALRSDAGGAPETAFVLNTLENTVSIVDVSDPADLRHVRRIGVGDDPTRDIVRRGRIAFNNAFASTTGTFACASCHPDGNVDQLLWVLGPQCSFEGCDQQEPRSTMPIRGLRDTLPLHWDGTLGDPFGGPDGETGLGSFGDPSTFPSAPPTCDADDPKSCVRHLVDATFSGALCDVSDGCPSGGELSEAERDAMSAFLLNVAYPPARERRPDDRLSESAVAGFEDFFTNRGGAASPAGVTTCGDAGNGCHALPLMAGTAGPDNPAVVGGFDAPTMRGLNDRFLLFSAGVTLIPELLQSTAAFPVLGIDLPPEFRGNFQQVDTDERISLAVSFFAFSPLYNVGPANIFQMIQEGSTGLSGAAGRQVTLNARTTRGDRLAVTESLLDALEEADRKGLVNLQAEGADGGAAEPLSFQRRVYRGERGRAFTRRALIEQARGGSSVVTVTARLPANAGAPDHPQPLLSPSEEDQESVLFGGDDPVLPVLDGRGPQTFDATGRNLREGSVLFLDGERLAPGHGRIECASGRFTPFCEAEAGGEVPAVRITLGSGLVRGLEPGMHLLQVQSPQGLLSNELPVLVQGGGR